MAKAALREVNDRGVLRAPLPHAEGCPKGRTETVPNRRPSGEPVVVTRCLDCGAQRLDEGA